MLWNWDRTKLLAKMGIGLTGQIVASPCNFQVSWNPHDQSGSSIVVTGPQNTFKYLKYKVEEKEAYFAVCPSQINNGEENRSASQNYTCHAWSKDTGMLLVCTEGGEMLVCENTGEYRAYLNDSPLGHVIEAAYAFESGFLIAIGTSFLIFKSSPGDDRKPFKMIGGKTSIAMS